MVSDALPDGERVQREIEEQEFARGHVPPGSPPVEPRPAATICLARPSRSAFEVLLLRRPSTSRFAARAHVFPGGTVDPEDRAAEALACLKGGAQEPAALIAALREAFEETGLLATATLRSEGSAKVLEEGRGPLLAGQTTFHELLTAAGATLEAAQAAYFARWITPIQLSRRYDTRFFLARHPGGEPALTREHTASRWLEPPAALKLFAAGRLPMLFPTRKTLELLGGFATLEAAFESFRRREVEPILARLIVEGGRVVPAPVDLV